eukprot:scaffold158493_cov21-Tisochrysis_lutea.AAC.1
MRRRLQGIPRHQQCRRCSLPSQADMPPECSGGPGHPASACSPGAAWAWGGTGCKPGEQES